MEWQSIETVPKDGSPVLLFNFKTQKEHKENLYGTFPNTPIVGGWCNEEEEFFGIDQWGKLNEFSYVNPSHWMSLPQPPKEEK